MSGNKTSHKGVQSTIDLQKNAAEQARQATVQANREQTVSKGLSPGPSGRPALHFVHLPSQARAYDYAQNASKICTFYLVYLLV